ncbi:MAG: DUF2513 domain-containing protein, partial [Phycisphaerales bacterium]
MKRDMDLVRDLLLAVEAIPPAQAQNARELAHEAFDHRNADEVLEHLRMLDDAGLILCIDLEDMDGYDAALRGLTWEGSEFLDSIRNEGAMVVIRETIANYGS